MSNYSRSTLVGDWIERRHQTDLETQSDARNSTKGTAGRFQSSGLGRLDHVSQMMSDSESRTSDFQRALHAKEHNESLGQELNAKRRTGIRRVHVDGPSESLQNTVFRPSGEDHATLNKRTGSSHKIKDQIDANMQCEKDFWDDSKRGLKAAPAPELAAMESVRLQMIHKLNSNAMDAHELFDRLDTDKSGVISLDTFRRGLRRSLGIIVDNTSYDRLCVCLDPQTRSRVSRTAFLAWAKGASVMQIKEVSRTADEKLCKELRGENDAVQAGRAVVELLRDKIRGKNQKLARIFTDMDTDGSGSLDASELDRALGKMGIDLDREQLKGLMWILDVSGDGQVDYREFLSVLSDDALPKSPVRKERANEEADQVASSIVIASAQSRRLNDIRSKIRDKISQIQSLRSGFVVRDAFLKLDSDGSGTLSRNEFRRFCRSVNLELTIPDVEALMNALDTDKSGEIDYDEFAAFMRGSATDAEIESEQLGMLNDDEMKMLHELEESGVFTRLVEKLSVRNLDAISVFERFDKDKSGSLSHENLLRAFRALDVQVDNRMFRQMTDVLDPSGTGCVRYGPIAELLVNATVSSPLKRVNSSGDEMSKKHEFGTSYQKELEIRRLRKAHWNDSQFDIRDEQQSANDRFSQTEIADLKIIQKLKQSLEEERPRFMELFTKYDRTQRGKITHDIFRRLLSDLGCPISAPDAHRLLLRLDQSRSGLVALDAIFSIVQDPRGFIVSQRESVLHSPSSGQRQGSTNGNKSLLYVDEDREVDHNDEDRDLDRSSSHMMRRLSVAETRSPSKHTEDEYVAHYDRVLDFDISGTLMNKFVSSLRKIEAEYPRIVSFWRAKFGSGKQQPQIRSRSRPSSAASSVHTTPRRSTLSRGSDAPEEVCTAAELRSSCYELGILISEPDFNDIFALLDVDEMGVIPVLKVAISASRALAYLEERQTGDSKLREQRETKATREYKPRTPYALHDRREAWSAASSVAGVDDDAYDEEEERILAAEEGESEFRKTMGARKGAASGAASQQLHKISREIQDAFSFYPESPKYRNPLRERAAAPLSRAERQRGRDMLEEASVGRSPPVRHAYQNSDGTRSRVFDAQREDRRPRRGEEGEEDEDQEDGNGAGAYNGSRARPGSSMRARPASASIAPANPPLRRASSTLRGNSQR
eukprot:ANDGO_02218.mRNA.1 Caltractin